MSTLAHGYTLRDLDGLAHSATVAAGFAATNYQDRYDESWSAIVEALYTAEQAPGRRDLWYVGRNAVLAAVRDDRRHYGAPAQDRDADLASAHGFVRYWGNVVTCDFSGGVIDRFACFQIWPHLSATHQQALLALAAAGTVPCAADMLGLSPGNAQNRIDRARAAFRALWHEHEQPAGLWRKALAHRDVAGLKPCGTTAAYTRHRRRREPVDAACAEAWRVYGRDKKRERTQAAVTTGSNPAGGAS